MAYQTSASAGVYNSGPPSHASSYPVTSQIGFVNNPESALVPVPKQVPTLTPVASTGPVNAPSSSNGQQQQQSSLSANYTVAPRARRPSEKVADDNLIDLDGLGQSLDK